MKKSALFLSACVLAFSTVFISACSDDEGGGATEIPPALVKTLTAVYDGDYEAKYEFTYDAANNNRLTLVNVTEDCCEPYTITYDYSVANRVTENENGWETVFVLDNEGRIIKSLWDSEDENDNFDGYQYDEDGFLIRTYYKEDGVEVTKETATIASDNITVHNRLPGSGESIRSKTFTYISNAGAINVSDLPQANLINSERRSISGLYGKGSRKLVDYLELNYPEGGGNYAKNFNAYTFDDDNRVLTITRSGEDAEGNATSLNEVFTYTYYVD